MICEMDDHESDGRFEREGFRIFDGVWVGVVCLRDGGDVFLLHGFQSQAQSTIEQVIGRPLKRIGPSSFSEACKMFEDIKGVCTAATVSSILSNVRGGLRE